MIACSYTAEEKDKEFKFKKKPQLPCYYFAQARYISTFNLVNSRSQIFTDTISPCCAYQVFCMETKKCVPRKCRGSAGNQNIDHFRLGLDNMVSNLYIQRTEEKPICPADTVH